MEKTGDDKLLKDTVDKSRVCVLNCGSWPTTILEISFRECFHFPKLGRRIQGFGFYSSSGNLHLQRDQNIANVRHAKSPQFIFEGDGRSQVGTGTHCMLEKEICRAMPVIEVNVFMWTDSIIVFK